jgi:cell division protein FtsW (lipid II flippase)
MGLAIPTAQRYLLNRSFGLRLSWWWVVLTFMGYTAGFNAATHAELLTRNVGMPDLISTILWFVILMGIPSMMQWWMLQKYWHHAWVWVIVSIISGYLVFQLMGVFLNLDIDWIHLDYRNGLEMIPSGLAHGLLTGITALVLNRFARKHPSEKNKPSLV